MTSAQATLNKPFLTTHVLDTSIGRPAANLKIELFVLTSTDAQTKEPCWELLGAGSTNKDGRLVNSIYPLEKNEFEAATYRLRFHTSSYFSSQQVKGFYPWADVVFEIDSDTTEHYHVPLLLNPFGYSTYRGS
mmetsp:Transcript_10200/g.15368  ORF Transcript_10200/g.15368 Transcript_10200/m.15368 type:complete len:133 (+) Transcript_10200:56-454(+)